MARDAVQTALALLEASVQSYTKLSVSSAPWRVGRTKKDSELHGLAGITATNVDKAPRLVQRV
jgi:hypothetical protein